MRNFFVGIDLGGTRIKIGVVSGGEILSRKIVPADAAAGLEASLPVLEKEIGELLGSVGAGARALGGIGLAFAGIVDPAGQRILSTNQKYDDAMQVDVADWVKKRWGVPFFIDNDARMSAVGEWKYGAARDTEDMVMMTIGTGIGSSAVIEGKVLRGRHFQAGVLGGHISIRYDGRPCNCGNIGCLEAYGSTWCLAATVQSAGDYSTSVLAGEPVIDYYALFEAAGKGDPLAVRIRQECLDIWSAGVINLIHAYDPEVVVIGGGVMSRPEEILPHITGKVGRHAWTPWGKVAIRATQLHGDAGIVGVVHCLQHNI
ncbi:MAG TPA: ROK family protein [Puia sp.]|nr:ROK family protein [Puia sp.]